MIYRSFFKKADNLSFRASQNFYLASDFRSDSRKPSGFFLSTIW